MAEDLVDFTLSKNDSELSKPLFWDEWFALTRAKLITLILYKYNEIREYQRTKYEKEQVCSYVEQTLFTKKVNIRNCSGTVKKDHKLSRLKVGERWWKSG